MDFSTRAFIFDMDGTLVDNMHVHAKAFKQLLDENGIEMATDKFDKFIIETAGRTNREIMPTVFGEDVSGERIDELASRKEELYREAFLPIRRPVEGLVDFLTEAHELGIKLAVATAGGQKNMEFILDGLDLRKFFDAVTTSADVSNGKPNPEVFLVSAEKLGVEPRNCLVFEDAFGGFEAAHRAGMKSIGLTTVNTAEDILARDSVVEAYADFTSVTARELVEKHLPFRDSQAA
jgi:beta-phosphoglucomutase family hydrolase